MKKDFLASNTLDQTAQNKLEIDEKKWYGVRTWDYEKKEPKKGKQRTEVKFNRALSDSWAGSRTA